MKPEDLLPNEPQEIGDSLGTYEALQGDFGPLIDQLRSNAKLTRRQRELLALILEGKFRRPKRRVRKEATREFEEAIAYFVMSREAEGVKNESAVHEAMEVFDRGERSVRSAVSKHRLRASGPYADWWFPAKK
jgi:hypothetical protein